MANNGAVKILGGSEQSLCKSEYLSLNPQHLYKNKLWNAVGVSNLMKG